MPRSERRHRDRGGVTKGDRRREAILAALERLLGDVAIADLDVGTIAAAAGVSRPGFYFYFESKYAALSEALQRVADEMDGIAESFSDGDDALPEDGLPRA